MISLEAVFDRRFPIHKKPAVRDRLLTMDDECYRAVPPKGRPTNDYSAALTARSKGISSKCVICLKARNRSLISG